MLKYLRINNIILIEFTEIDFSEGFNVLSGETGSGKSAILNALELLTGERADSGLIRRGADKGVVEAAFDISGREGVLSLLEEAGIDHECDQELIIRREISLNDKNRSYINNQLVQIKILRMLGSQLMEIVGQHANQRLLSLDKHTEILDLFGGLEKETAFFKKNWHLETRLQHQLDELIQHEAQRLRDIEVCRMELEELEEAQLKEGEDEALFAEYTLLSNAEERAEKVNAILDTLSGERQSVLQMLNRHKHTFQELSKLDPNFIEPGNAYQAACLELQEITYTLRTASSHIEYQPEKAAKINERLTQISRMKRKFGQSLEEIFAYRQNIKEKKEKLENADILIEELQEELKKMRSINDEACKALTLERLKSARELEKALTIQLHALNMAKAEFHIEIVPQKRTELGDDRIEFFFTPNAGEHRISIRECASGGELSRLLLGLQTLLAKKARIPTIIFDEIDSNIGGATASIVGRKLKEIGNYHQVLCITHFPQVAQEADLHIQIAKMEKEGRTVTKVRALDTADREKELSRMYGNPVPV